MRKWRRYLHHMVDEICDKAESVEVELHVDVQGENVEPTGKHKLVIEYVMEPSVE